MPAEHIYIYIFVKRKKITKFWEKDNLYNPVYFGINKKITRRTTTGESKQVFASNCKFQIKSIIEQVTYGK